MKINKEIYGGITGSKNKYIPDIFFIIGLIAAIGFRLVLLLNKISSVLANIAWYTAIILYVFFYIYRLYIEEKRRRLIIKNKLREKIIENKCSMEDREKIRILLDSVLISKLRWNLIILIIVSILALILQIIIDIGI